MTICMRRVRSRPFLASTNAKAAVAASRPVMGLRCPPETITGTTIRRRWLGALSSARTGRERLQEQIFNRYGRKIYCGSSPSHAQRRHPVGGIPRRPSRPDLRLHLVRHSSGCLKTFRRYRVNHVERENRCDLRPLLYLIVGWRSRSTGRSRSRVRLRSSSALGGARRREKGQVATAIA